MDATFRAFVVDKQDGAFSAEMRDLQVSDLPEGELVIRVAYSGVNYKDGLASVEHGKVAMRYPLVPGIDLAGVVVESNDARFAPGMEVLATGYDLGTSHSGGFGEYARVPAPWTVPLPEGLTLREAMILGTAGFTAALSIDRLEANGLRSDQGPVLVTGATGGVGSLAITMLAQLGYSVAASTGKHDEHDYLRALGAGEILSRDETSAESARALEKERWAGSIDSVGGTTLAYLLRTTRRAGAIASFGVADGGAVQTTVFPFILRGVSVLGVDSAFWPMERRLALWQRMATDLKPRDLDHIVAREVGLDDLGQVTSEILAGRIRGRVIVKLS